MTTTFDGTADTFVPLQPTCRVGGNACDLSAGWLDGLCLEHWSPDGDPTDETVAAQLDDALASMDDFQRSMDRLVNDPGETPESRAELVDGLLALAPPELPPPGGYTVAIRSDEGTLVAEGDAVLVVPADPAVPAVAFQSEPSYSAAVIERDAEWDRAFQETVRLATMPATALVRRPPLPGPTGDPTRFSARLRATVAHWRRVRRHERSTRDIGRSTLLHRLGLFDPLPKRQVVLGIYVLVGAIALSLGAWTGHV